MKKSLVSLAIALALSAGAAHAERIGIRHSFSVDATRTGPNGTSLRHTAQTATDNGFNRTTSVTGAAGKTATHDVSVVNDATTGTHTRAMSGTTFSGKSYSGESTIQKTDTGFTHDSSFTGVDGKTVSKDVTATVDKENHTVSKDISVTTPNGEVHDTTVVKQYSKTDGNVE